MVDEQAGPCMGQCMGWCMGGAWVHGVGNVLRVHNRLTSLDLSGTYCRILLDSWHPNMIFVIRLVLIKQKEDSKLKPRNQNT